MIPIEDMVTLVKYGSLLLTVKLLALVLGISLAVADGCADPEPEPEPISWPEEAP